MKYVLLTLALLISSNSYSNSSRRNQYVEMCFEGTEICSLGSIDTYGRFNILFRENTKVRHMRIADVSQKGPFGDMVALIREPPYQKIVSQGLERIYFNVNNFEKELEDIQDELDRNLIECLAHGFVCVGTFAEAIGSSGLLISIAATTCYLAYNECNKIQKANDALFARRKKIREMLEEEAEKSAQENSRSSSGSGSGGERIPGRPDGVPAGHGGFELPSGGGREGRVTIIDHGSSGGGSRGRHRPN